VSLKVLPQLPATVTLRLDADQASAIKRLNEWGGQPLPLNASAWWDGTLVLRLSGAAAAVQSARRRASAAKSSPNPRPGPSGPGLRDHRDEFFIGAPRPWTVAPACGG
jgi:glycolate oxidase FAD binding subunit